MTAGFNKERSPITRKKLARDVAKRIKAYLKELENDETPFPVRFEDMFITRLHHVSRACWQPEIWYQVAPPTGP
ncbi:hypothetical protein BDM02DRAFT_3116923 [Thelephora ganbajun]|uniref:Uncharacterized protein n=1 Tax=Thelephora ganbajun TaxID=370292 RepID=A0ACB6ZD97_THEGA|nr:hypothetical protein BDM02DRAFT_3116923 [Thelephora ganbajun]